METPCKLHGCSYPSLEARASQSKHVLGEHGVQNQAGVRTAELTEAQDRAPAGQTTDREMLALALPRTGGHVLQKHTWRSLLPKGCSTLGTTKAQHKLSLSVAGPGDTRGTLAGVTFLALWAVKLIFCFAEGTQPEFPCKPTLLNNVLYRNTRAVCSDEAEGKELRPAP